MNPWEEIKLLDYENHMSLDSVKQLQVLNELMKEQFSTYPVETATVFGVAGGNGLEHVSNEKYKKVYGIDINEEFLSAARKRYKYLGNALECLKIDLINELEKLPQAEIIIANLFIEYVGYDVFKRSVLRTEAKYVSCVIQINSNEGAWVSESPYIHAFDGLDEVHHQMEEETLIQAMEEIEYRLIKTAECKLPNGKKFVMLDFERSRK